MKVYRYYMKRKHIPDIFDNRRGNPNDLVLYAHTADPEIAKEFEEFRNMKRFRKMVNKMSKKEYNAYAHNAQAETLQKQEYLYFGDKMDANNQKEALYVWLVLTVSESETHQYIMDSGIIKEFDFFCPGIFKNEYYDALNTIQYVNAFKTWMVAMDSHALKELADIMALKGEYDEEFGPLEIEYDEVEVFISLFASTL